MCTRSPSEDLEVVVLSEGATMTLDQWADTVKTILDIGSPGLLVFALIAIWKGWFVPKRETDVLHDTIAIQAKTIDVLETANDRLLDEIAKPLAAVLSTLPTQTARRK